MQNSARPKLPIWLRLIIVTALVGFVWLSQRPPAEQPGRQNEITAPPSRAPEAEGPRPLGSSTSDYAIKAVTLKDQTGRVIYNGDIDLAPTLDRIAAGKELRFPNDGSVFQNRERRLPRQAAGYYREYVVPTPGEDGPGPQRLVIGKEGETFYTHDHYRTFRRVK